MAATLPFWLALQGGGFDAVVRHQFALVIWWAIAIGLLAGVLPRARIHHNLFWPALALAGLIAWTALSFAWTESDERTYEELTRVIGHAGVICAAWLTLNRYTFAAAAGGLTTGALALASLAVLSRLAPSGFPVDEVTIALDVDRLNYPFDYWNAVAAWGSMSIAAGLVWSAHARKPFVRAVALAAVPTAALAVYLTYSRAGVAAVAIGLLAALAMSRNRWTLGAHILAAGAAAGVAILTTRGQPMIADATGGEGGSTIAVVLLLACGACAGVAIATQLAGFDRLRIGKKQAKVGVGAVGTAVLVLLVLGVASGHLSRAYDEFQSDDLVAETARGTDRLNTLGGDRDELWSSAVDAFSGEKLTGIGPGSFEYWWSRDGREAAPVEDAHSLYFETLAELGLPGLALLGAFIAGLAAAGLRARSRLTDETDVGAWAAMLSVFAVFVVYAGVDWLWEYPSVTAVGLGAAAIASAGSLRRSRGIPIRGKKRVAAGLVALVAGASQVPGIVTTERLRQSEEALASGDTESALELADDARSAQRWAASPLAARALAEEVRGNLVAARSDLIDARDIEPTNWLWAAQLARVELALGNRVAAERAAAKASDLNKLFDPGLRRQGEPKGEER
ncbi:MAG: O-antigen ligase family protein [Solirubrobacterales bacterium]|nr:O-antigen ligase family protein [Solirubrobacterales bacterium]